MDLSYETLPSIDIGPAALKYLCCPDTPWDYQMVHTFVSLVKLNQAKSKDCFVTTIYEDAKTYNTYNNENHIVAILFTTNHYGVVYVNIPFKTISVFDWMGLAGTNWGFDVFNKWMSNANVCKNVEWSFVLANMSMPDEHRQNACGPLSCAKLAYLTMGWSYSNDESIRQQTCAMLWVLLRDAQKAKQLDVNTIDRNAIRFADEDRNEWFENPFQCTCKVLEGSTNPLEVVVVSDCKTGHVACLECFIRTYTTFRNVRRLCFFCRCKIETVTVFTKKVGCSTTKRNLNINDSLENILDNIRKEHDKEKIACRSIE